MVEAVVVVEVVEGQEVTVQEADRQTVQIDVMVVLTQIAIEIVKLLGV